MKRADIAAMAVDAQRRVIGLNAVLRHAVQPALLREREIQRARLEVCSELFAHTAAANDMSFDVEDELA